MKRKICFVSGTRADYGLLFPLMKAIAIEPDFQLQLIATGMHLSPEFGLTYRKIQEDGFQIDAKVEMLLSSDTGLGVTKSLGLGLIGMADALENLKPDLLVLLGDRFEILAAAQAALIAKVPVAHLCGGDSTEGAFDEAMRHSITKMAHLHFVTNEVARRRVMQLGENPQQVFLVGSPALDYLKSTPLLSRQELEDRLDFKLKKHNLLITFHPSTLDRERPESQFQELLAALTKLGPDFGLIFTKPNADTGGRGIIQQIEEFSAKHENAKAYTSLGQLLYWSTVAQVEAVVGNSSSGLYEVPSFKKPTVNIGDRQKGRLKADSVLDCSVKASEIFATIQLALEKDFSQTKNPYGDGDSVPKILAILKRLPSFQELLQKSFFDLNL